MITSAMLRKLECEVTVVNNGREALAAMACEAYDCLLMDCQMPIMDGFEATTSLREREGDGSRTVIIALTASATKHDRDRACAVGVDDYLGKPLTLNDLEAALARWASDAGALAGEL